MIELERYGAPYFKCPECEYGAFNKAYVEAHVAGAHQPAQLPGAERGVTAEPIPTTEPTPSKGDETEEPAE